MGCAMPEAEQGMNVARAAAIRAGLPVETSAMTINRFCSSGLQSIALASDRIRSGGADVIVAGGLETMSLIPMGSTAMLGYGMMPYRSRSAKVTTSWPLVELGRAHV